MDVSAASAVLLADNLSGLQQMLDRLSSAMRSMNLMLIDLRQR